MPLDKHRMLAIGRDVGPPHILIGRFSIRKVGFFVSLFLLFDKKRFSPLTASSWRLSSKGRQYRSYSSSASIVGSFVA
jgi:hypothetical protein